MEMNTKDAGVESAVAEFVHLRLHTDYSVVDGLVPVKSLFPAVKKKGMFACAVTDLMNEFATIKVFKAATKEGIKPIFGADVLIEDEQFEEPILLTLLCQNDKGYRHLTELISKGYLDGNREGDVPALNKEWFTVEAMEGIIALSGDVQGDIGQNLLLQHSDKAEQCLLHWLSVFGEGRFFIALQRIGQPDEQSYIQAAVELAAKHKVPVVATHNVRFLKPSDYEAHEVRVAIHESCTLDDPRHTKAYRDQQYLKSPEEMVELFKDIPSAIENAVQIAKRCNVNFELGKACLPNFPVPEGMDVNSFLRQVSSEGLEHRMKSVLPKLPEAEHEAAKKEYQARLDLELDVIISMGFSGYFLIVADFIRWAKDNSIPVGPGRGSGAGSLVAYALDITDVDPIPYDLLFERFLNPERVSMPDFDIDFCIDGRDKVIEYVMQKYGHDAVSQIITFGSMAAKAVVRDVGRVMGHPYGFVDGVAKLIPMDIGMTLSKALEEEEAFKQRYDEDEEVKALVDMGLKLEGTVRNVGKHAGGVVISPTVLTDFCAVYCEKDSRALVSQFDKDDVEAAGLVKFDFLGLRNLTIIDAALKNINHNLTEAGKPIVDIAQIPLNDERTFKLLKRCQTTAVFQLESRGMKDLIRRLQPDCFEEIIALVALFRPGPLQSGMVDDFINRKHGRARIQYPHPDTEEILKPTYGIILYQEQVMMIPQILAGYTLGGADILRRAMGKKKPEEMEKQRAVFMKGALEYGIEEATGTYIFDLMEKFSGYGFNKSHSAAYALVAYQTAYLKAHFPAEFMAAVLSSDMDNTDKVVNFVEDCGQMSLTIERPNVNSSFYRFTVEDGAIRFGLGAVKGVGMAAIENIIEEREKEPFKDFFDLCRRTDSRKVNKRSIEALVYAGAMDDLGPDRESIYASIEKAMKAADKHRKDEAFGQNDLFAESDSSTTSLDFVRARNVNLKERYIHERETLGLFLSGHPINEIKDQLHALRIQPLLALKPTDKNGKPQRIAGVIVASRRIKTRRGGIMLVVTLDDSTTKMEVTFFSDVLEQFRDYLVQDACLVIEAQVTHDDYSGNLRIVAKDVMSVEEARMKYARLLNLNLNRQIGMEVLSQVKVIMEEFKGGECPVRISYQNDDAKVEFTCDDSMRVVLSDDCLQKLKALVGESGVAVQF